MVFRGIAFEFRFQATRWRLLWDWAFSGGSALAGFCQGLVLGGFINGIPVGSRTFLGGTFDFLNGFTVVCGLGLIAGYALLGAIKTAGTSGAFGRTAARYALLASQVFLGLISIWTPLTHPEIARRWFSWPGSGVLWPVPIMSALVAYGIRLAIGGADDRRPFGLAIALFLLSFLGLGISLWPYAVPFNATLWDASSSPRTQAFVGIGPAVILPIILGYLSYAHWILRGKTAPGSGYGQS